jgi:hypothetical protein
MQISNVTAGYSDPATIGKRSEPLETLGARILKAVDPRAAAASGSKSAAAAILARYDVTNITPMAFSEMIQKLNQAGAISDSEFQELAAVRGDLESAGIRADESVNLVDFYAHKVSTLQNRIEDNKEIADKQSLGPLLKRQDWVQKFALMQSNPGAAGLDAVA